MLNMLSLLPASLITLALSMHAVTASDDSTVDMVATTWYAGWHSQDFPLSDVSWDKYTQVTYAFAVTTPDVTQLSLAASDESLLPQFVSAAHQNDVKAAISIGGWTGSQWFSSNVGSAANRTAFVKTVTDLATKYQLDGLDFDWEYPNHQGVGCNVVNSADTDNFLSFLQELRADSVGKTLTLSAATSVTPWVDASGSPSTSLSGFASVLDFIEVMNYDIWGSWSTGVGPNAPLNDSCVSTASEKQGSAVSALEAWTAAGIPAHQIVLGVAAYGHSFSVSPSDAFTSGSTSELTAYPAFNAANQPPGDKWNDQAGDDVCGVYQPAGGDYDFWGMIDAGFLMANGTAADGIAYRFDACSQTPYVYNSTSQIMISFDDSRSFAAKGEFIKDSNLRGFAMWEAGGDSNDVLLDSIRTAVGLDDGDDSDC